MFASHYSPNNSITIRLYVLLKTTRNETTLYVYNLHQYLQYECMQTHAKTAEAA